MHVHVCRMPAAAEGEISGSLVMDSDVMACGEEGAPERIRLWLFLGYIWNAT